MLFRSVFVMAFHAPDSGEDEKFMEERTNILHEGRRELGLL